MKNKILYLLFLLFDSFLIVMYDGEFQMILLGFALLFGGIQFILAHWLGDKISAELKIIQTVVQKGETIQLKVTLHNRSRLPVNRCVVKMAYANSLTGERGITRLVGAVPGRGEMGVTEGISSGACGLLTFTILNIRVYDYLHLFYSKKKSQGLAEIPILPEVKECKVVLTEHTRRFVSDGEEYEKNQKGDDPSELFQVREFRQGDTLQRVHWKLTARKDELMTKEFSMPKGCKILLLLDTYVEKGERKLAERMDGAVEFVTSLSQTLLQQECVHKIGWYSGKDHDFCRFRVETEEDYYDMVHGIIQAEVQEVMGVAAKSYKMAYPNEQYSTVLELKLDGTLFGNGRRKADFSLLSKDLGLEKLEIEV